MESYILIEVNGDSQEAIEVYSTRLKAENAALARAPYTYIEWKPECPYYIGSNPYGKEEIEYPTYKIQRVTEIGWARGIKTRTTPPDHNVWYFHNPINGIIWTEKSSNLRPANINDPMTRWVLN